MKTIIRITLVAIFMAVANVANAMPAVEKITADSSAMMADSSGMGGLLILGALYLLFGGKNRRRRSSSYDDEYNRGASYHDWMRQQGKNDSGNWL
ncbi:MAG: hypothetical protein LIP09_12175 [Bacteroidales bacterium]|nr:hypothetical protein [Bacteroidales bacterium]